MTRIKPVILAGGINTELWPVSYHFHLKQFIKIIDNQSLLQETIIKSLPFGKPIVIIGELYEKIAIEQIKELGIKVDTIIEPIPKNSGPCAIIAALVAKRKKADKILLLPVDHYVLEMSKYLSTINKMINNSYPISTVCTAPLSTDTDYNYAKASIMIDEGIYKSNQLITKLLKGKTLKYLLEKKYFWNLGIYLIDIEFILNQTQTLQPLLYNQAFNSLTQAAGNRNRLLLEKNSYSEIDEISIDQIITYNIQEMFLFITDV